jgi:N-acyl-phosphatidylethanolamine-hydrolysing phospholipase D
MGAGTSAPPKDFSFDENDLPRAHKMDNGVFTSPFLMEQRGFNDVMSWMLNREPPTFHPETLDTFLPTVPVDLDRVMAYQAGDPSQATWIGHATVLVQMHGFTFITDPVFSGRCSPFQWAGPKRYRPVTCDLADLVDKIDFVLLSHNHYDHLDQASALTIGDKAKWFVPLGLKEWFDNEGISNVEEMNWWDQATFVKESKEEEGGESTVAHIAFTPTQHWTGRWAVDRNKTLWGSFAVWFNEDNPLEQSQEEGEEEVPDRFFFGGDTGYCDVFKLVGERYGPFAFSAIPIGAYIPNWFMRPSHVSPYEAAQIHVDLKSKQSLAVHWGTFPLADERVLQAPADLVAGRKDLGLTATDFFTLRHGESWEFGSTPESDFGEMFPEKVEEERTKEEEWGEIGKPLEG